MKQNLLTRKKVARDLAKLIFRTYGLSNKLDYAKDKSNSIYKRIKEEPLYDKMGNRKVE